MEMISCRNPIMIYVCEPYGAWMCPLLQVWHVWEVGREENRPDTRARHARRAEPVSPEALQQLRDARPRQAKCRTRRWDDEETWPRKDVTAQNNDMVWRCANKSCNLKLIEDWKTIFVHSKRIYYCQTCYANIMFSIQ